MAIHILRDLILTIKLKGQNSFKNLSLTENWDYGMETQRF